MAEEKKNKRPTGFRVDDQTLQQVQALMPMDGSRSFQQFCERALQFYMGYLLTQQQESYLNRTIENTLRGLFGQFESDLRRDQNKIAIGVAELMMALLLTTEYTPEELTRIRGRAAKLVRQYGGPASMGRTQKELYDIFAANETGNE